MRDGNYTLKCRQYITQTACMHTHLRQSSPVRTPTRARGWYHGRVCSRLWGRIRRDDPWCSAIRLHRSSIPAGIIIRLVQPFRQLGPLVDAVGPCRAGRVLGTTSTSAIPGRVIGVLVALVALYPSDT